jgi:predicted acyl esterase
MGYIEPAPVDARADQVMVRMRDGVRLATDVYLPTAPGSAPTMLVRLPYDKCARYTFMPQIAPFVVDRGYALVVQDVRGKFRSEGETMPFVHEVEDGYDTLEWITAQSWSDGTVGMWGDSYYGYTQWAAVVGQHPALRAIVPRVTGTDFMDSRRWWGDHVLQLYGADYLAHFWTDRYIYDFPVDYDHRPLAELFDVGFAAVGKRSEAFDRFVLGRGPGGYAAYPPGRHPYERQRVPALHGVGWFDNVMPYSMADYMALTALPARAGLQYLYAEPIDHENYRLEDLPITSENDHDSNDAAMEALIPRLVGPGLDFFDVFLRGAGRADDVPRVRFRTGHGGWSESQTWPPPGVSELRLHLAAPERAAADAEGGALVAFADARTGRASWVHDPGDLVPSSTPDPFALLRGWPDETAIEGRPDVLTFTTESGVSQLRLVGQVTARLSVESTCDSMHVHVKLLDVSPEGPARMLLRGQRFVGRAEYGLPVSVDLGHTAYRLLPGHRLRLHIASSDFPLYLWHPGTAESPWTATSWARNEQGLLTGGDRGSCLDLTVIEEEDRLAQGGSSS